ncbi:uncharacterized protein LOC120295506 [Eucalyptus grandis]|uniref:uncharacterized protein LOC120295506 n=1 Tax=Eucalyptus grandis TaxID=71139 RepID=UPI00192F0D59|nr:uncharacterized protein LOC120295506 [Eucalyptus grandis]
MHTIFHVYMVKMVFDYRSLILILSSLQMAHVLFHIIDRKCKKPSTLASSSTSNTPNDSGTGQAHVISAQASEEIMIETENQNKMLISRMPDSIIPIIPQQTQMHEEQSWLYNGYPFIDGIVTTVMLCHVLQAMVLRPWISGMSARDGLVCQTIFHT